MAIRYPRLGDVSYQYRYYVENCRRRHSIEYLEDRKVKLENLVATGAELVSVDKKGNILDVDSDAISKELKGIKKQLNYLKRKGR